MQSVVFTYRTPIVHGPLGDAACAKAPENGTNLLGRFSTPQQTNTHPPLVAHIGHNSPVWRNLEHSIGWFGKACHALFFASPYNLGLVH